MKEIWLLKMELAGMHYGEMAFLDREDAEKVKKVLEAEDEALGITKMKYKICRVTVYESFEEAYGNGTEAVMRIVG